MTKALRFIAYFLAFGITMTFLGTLIFDGNPATDPEVHQMEILIWAYLVLFGFSVFFFVGIAEVIIEIVERFRKKPVE